LFEQVLRHCASGRSVRLPEYDFTTHCRKPHLRLVKPEPLIIVDGLWLLRRPALRSLFAFRIFIRCCTLTRLRRRVSRDTASRGRTARSVREQFWKAVEPMHRKYVLQQEHLANFVLSEACGSHEIRMLAERIQRALQQARTLLPAEP